MSLLFHQGALLHQKAETRCPLQHTYVSLLLSPPFSCLVLFLTFLEHSPDAFCPAFRCQQIKGQIANLTSSEKSTSMFQRHEFCPKRVYFLFYFVSPFPSPTTFLLLTIIPDKCEVDNCELLRDEAKNGHLGKFCPKRKSKKKEENSTSIRVVLLTSHQTGAIILAA
jgi:hypothetical protein